MGALVSTPFDDWLRRQQLPDAGSIPPEQLALLRASYEESVASAAKVTRWTPRARSSPADDLYAVAVRDDADLWLLTWVKRTPKKRGHDFMMMLPRPDRSIDAHATQRLDVDRGVRQGGRLLIAASRSFHHERIEGERLRRTRTSGQSAGRVDRPDEHERACDLERYGSGAAIQPNHRIEETP